MYACDKNDNQQSRYCGQLQETPGNFLLPSASGFEKGIASPPIATDEGCLYPGTKTPGHQHIGNNI